MAANEQVVTGLAKIGMALRAEGWREADAVGMSPTQAQILIYLVQRGPSRITAVADEIAVTQPTASDAAAALIRKGHLEKRPDPADARASLLHPTRLGRSAAKQMATWPDALLAAVDALSLSEQAAFLKGLTKMVRTLQEKRMIPLQRMCASCRFFRPRVHPDASAPHHCDFVDAAFGDADLRLDCGEHEAASQAQANTAWRRFAGPDANSTSASPAAAGEAP